MTIIITSNYSGTTIEKDIEPDRLPWYRALDGYTVTPKVTIHRALQECESCSA